MCTNIIQASVAKIRAPKLIFFLAFFSSILIFIYGYFLESATFWHCILYNEIFIILYANAICYMQISLYFNCHIFYFLPLFYDAYILASIPKSHLIYTIFIIIHIFKTFFYSRVL